MQEIDRSEKIKICEYLQRTVDLIKATHRNPHLIVMFHLEIPSIVCSPYIAVNVAQLVKELTENALRHGYKGRSVANIKIILTQDEKQCSLVVGDDGNGLNEEFNPYKSNSGLNLINIFASNLKGQIRVVQSHGTRFEIDFALE